MARKRRGGYRAPTNYDPRRGKQSAGGAQGPPGARRARHGAPAEHGKSDHQDVTAQQDARERSNAPQSRRRPAPSTSSVPIDLHVTSAADVAGLTFAELGLGGNIIRTLEELGATSPFPVQAATIPDSIAGHDVLGRAATGSGKTIAFGAAIVERLLKLRAQGVIPAPAKRPKHQRGERLTQHEARPPRAMIIAPTRELALQIDRTVQPIARSVGLYTAQLVGGVPIESQLGALARGIDIVIGTPGRMQDLVNRRKLDLRKVLITVIDEADHLCDLGFLESVQQLMRYTVRDGQRLLFSATLDGDVHELVDEFLRDARGHQVDEADDTSRVPHRVFLVLREEKDEVVTQLAQLPGQIMMFCRTRAGADRVATLLTGAGVSAVPLHGDLSQSRRERNLDQFATGKARVLVATDVAARGIHVDHVDHVVQIDPPHDHKTFLHRSGRTGRAGKHGSVITLSIRQRQQRTRAILEAAGVVPAYFGGFTPGWDPFSMTDQTMPTWRT